MHMQFPFIKKIVTSLVYTVAKANQNKALLCKIAVLGMKKPPLLVPDEMFPTPDRLVRRHPRSGWRNPT
jgi:hypothetical protein